MLPVLLLLRIRQVFDCCGSRRFRRRFRRSVFFGANAFLLQPYPLPHTTYTLSMILLRQMLQIREWDRPGVRPFTNTL